MRIREHGNVVAIALAGLAVVLALTGTAYAVTATKVTISDPAAPSRHVGVDQNRRLLTTGATSSINVTTSVGFDATFALTSPTTATLLVSAIGMSNPDLNKAYAGSTLSVSVVKIRAGTTGHCVAGTDGASVTATLGTRLLSPGSDIEIAYPAPLAVRSAGGKKYCLGLSVGHLGSGQTSLYLSSFQLSAYVSSGTYTGLGTASAHVMQPVTTRLVHR